MLGYPCLTQPSRLNSVAPHSTGSEARAESGVLADDPSEGPPDGRGALGAGRSLRPRLSIAVNVPPRTGVVVFPIALAAAAVCSVALSRGIDILWGPVLALLVAAVLAEMFPVPIEGVRPGATSFAGVFIAGSAALYGWRAGALVGALTMLLVELYSWRPVVRLFYNSSLYALGGAAAGAIPHVLPTHYRTGILSLAAFYVVNVGLLSAVASRIKGEPYLRVARSFYVSTSLPFVVMTATTAILVQLWRNSPWWALLLAPPLVAIVAYQRSLVAAVERQRELDQLKDEFIAVISHELRTPLASVYGGAVTLEQRELDESTRKRLISVVRREAARLNKLVDDVLWASRLDAKKVGGRDESCDAVAVVRDVVATASDLAPDGIEVVVEDAQDVPPVAADPEQLRRVLANLVDNAVKYSPDGGRVEVGARQVNGAVRFTVKDEGMGIAEEDRERIFEKFTRLDPQMKSGIGGTGLGLYICRELVGQMGGQIWVTGNVQRGSTFVFELPGRSSAAAG
jgi:signal transduction histidine kinase